MKDLLTGKTKYAISFTAAMRKDMKRAQKRGYDMREAAAVILKLANDEALDDRYHDHALGGGWVGHRELHIRPDWLLIYQKRDSVLVLELARTGTHSDLFGK